MGYGLNIASTIALGRQNVCFIFNQMNVKPRCISEASSLSRQFFLSLFTSRQISVQDLSCRPTEGLTVETIWVKFIFSYRNRPQRYIRRGNLLNDGSLFEHKIVKDILWRWYVRHKGVGIYMYFVRYFDRFIHNNLIFQSILIIRIAEECIL